METQFSRDRDASKSKFLSVCGLIVLATAVWGAERQQVPVSSGWCFLIDVLDLGEKERWYASGFDRSGWAGTVVPRAWDLHDEALWGYEGIGWYAVTLDGSLARPGRVQRLKFGRVNYHTKAWLNGELLGENVNGYLPFEFDVSGKLRSGGPNELVLRVDNRPRLAWLPGAKQIEWIQYGGILEPVVLETTAPIYLSDLGVDAVPHGDGALIRCTLEVTSAEAGLGEAQIRLEVRGDVQAERLLRVKLSPGATTTAQASLQLERARAWSPDDPFLYSLRAVLEAGGLRDERSTRFGVRKIEARGRELLLNGKPFRVRGVNRYDEYGRFGPAPPRELLLADVLRMKRAGVNLVRTHYPQSPEILALYDEVGLAMIEEVPVNWWGNDFSGQGEELQSEAILDQAMPALERMIRRDKNHPSVIIWSMANESQTANEVGIGVMRRMLRRARELDPSRLATFVVGVEEVKPHRAFDEADLVAVNIYHGSLRWPLAHHIEDLDERVTQASAEFLRRQIEAFPDKPLLVTEFGGRGVPGIRGDVVYSEDFQAALIRAFWKAIERVPEVAGGVLWSWADYYHRRTFIQYAVFGPYGVVTVDRRPKIALRTLAEIYGGTVADH